MVNSSRSTVVSDVSLPRMPCLTPGNLSCTNVGNHIFARRRKCSVMVSHDATAGSDAGGWKGHERLAVNEVLHGMNLSG